MANAFNPLTNKALNAVGALIRKWALDEKARPAHVAESARVLVMDVAAFRAAMTMQDNQLQEGRDFTIRAGIEKVELVIRAPDRFTIVLPEPEALTRFRAPGKHAVQIPSIYSAASANYGAAGNGFDDPPPQVPNENDPASYPISVDDQTYKKFVDPYMAAYVCTQCA